VFAKAIAHYAEPSKAFIDALGASWHEAVGHPGAAEALTAHRIVDLAYRSAAAGGEARLLPSG
jgi:predicted dehydrogenase